MAAEGCTSGHSSNLADHTTPFEVGPPAAEWAFLRLKPETLHHITGCPTGCTSAEMEHFTRADWRRSLSAKRKLSVTPDGKGKSQNGFSGVRLSSPIWPSVGDPGSPAHFTRKWTLFFPYVAPMISSTLTRVRTPPSFAPF